MKLLAVIVNYRTASMSVEALHALMRELGDAADAQVVLVDNDSGDGSLAEIASAVEEEGWADRVSVVGSGRNGGLAFGTIRLHRAAEGHRTLRSRDPAPAASRPNPPARPSPDPADSLLVHLSFCKSPLVLSSERG